MTGTTDPWGPIPAPAPANRYSGPCRDCGHDHDDHDPNGPCMVDRNVCTCMDWRPGADATEARYGC